MSHSFQALTPLLFLDHAVELSPSEVAVVSRDVKMTYSDLWQRAAKIREVGLVYSHYDNANIAVIAENCADAVACHFGIPASGGVIVNINPFLQVDVILKQLSFVDVALVFVDLALAKKGGALLSALLNQFKVVLINDEPGCESVFDAESLTTISQGMRLSPAPLSGLITSEADPISINFTSGTTGTPKAVVVSHRAAYLHSMGQLAMFNLGRDSKYYWSLPMFHVNGWGHMWALVAARALQIIEPYSDYSIEASITDIINDYEINRLAGAPRLLATIRLESVKGSIRRRLSMMTGGSSPPRELVECAEMLGVKLIHQYGLNETLGPFVVYDRPMSFKSLDLAEKSRLLRRQGKEAIHSVLGVRVLDKSSLREVRRDGRTVGEIVLKGNTLALGYFNNQAATDEAFTSEGFFTGDLAVVHESGDIELVDRIKDVINVDTEYGWENVSSIEIENVILETGLVNDCAVVGYRNRDGFNQVAACVEFSTGVSEEQIVARCQKVLPDYKVPSMVVFTRLPKTATGKVKKEELRKMVDEINREPIGSSEGNFREVV